MALLPDSVATLEQALAGRTDLDRYGASKRLLFAAQLMLDIEDIHTAAETALVDGPDDKSCDLIYVDRDAAVAVLAQAYESHNLDRPSAEVNKARTLHQAVAWVFARHESGLPPGLTSAIREVRSALEEGAIREIKVWFLHNLPESENVRRELAAIEDAVRGFIRSRYPAASVDSVHAEEIGRSTLADWYASTLQPIMISDRIAVPVGGHYLVEECPHWKAYVTTVDADWINQQYWRHKDQLFSANVRDYLGSRRHQSNINQGIKKSVFDEPDNFWVYNNGITALVHDVEETEDGIVVSGLSVVNGAQTTGALGHPEERRNSLEWVRVGIRFIVCSNPEIVRKIIRYTNRQNAVEASDFRSTDRVQRRLVSEFKQLGIIGYTGGRRGGVEDIIRRRGPNAVTSRVTAQALAAFHGEPDIAYHRTREIWEANEVYHRFFSDHTRAEHILFCWSLLKVVEVAKQNLRELPSRTRSDRDQFEYLERRGSSLLMVAAVGGCVEELLDRAIADPFQLTFSREISRNVESMIDSWKPIVSCLLPWAKQHLLPVLDSGGLRRQGEVQKALEAFRNQVAMGISGIEEIRQEFAAKVMLHQARPAR